MRKQVLVLLADGFEEIEAIAVIDILRRAGLKVIAAGLDKRIVKGSRDIVVKADMELNSYHGLPDALVLPGGMAGVTNLSKSRRVNELIKETYAKNKIIAAICAAPSYVLFPLGILKGRKATCYPGCEDMLSGETEFVDKKVVIDGNLITSKGPGTAFDFALALVEALVGKSIKETVRKKILHEIGKK